MLEPLTVRTSIGNPPRLAGEFDEDSAPGTRVSALPVDGNPIRPFSHLLHPCPGQCEDPAEDLMPLLLRETSD